TRQIHQRLNLKAPPYASRFPDPCPIPAYPPAYLPPDFGYRSSRALRGNSCPAVDAQRSGLQYLSSPRRPPFADVQLLTNGAAQRTPQPQSLSSDAHTALRRCLE